ncbi:uncharacterized protein METZ01_LOCUS276242, partial [marine metagenome]
ENYGMYRKTDIYTMILSAREKTPFNIYTNSQVI